MNQSQLIIEKPHLTEKAVDLSHDHKYVFLVTAHATGSEVKKLVEKMYSVKVVKYNVVNLPGKRTRFGNKFSKPERRKKVIVTLKEGQTIDTIPQ